MENTIILGNLLEYFGGLNTENKQDVINTVKEVNLPVFNDLTNDVYTIEDFEKRIDSIVENYETILRNITIEL